MINMFMGEHMSAKTFDKTKFKEKVANQTQNEQIEDLEELFGPEKYYIYITESEREKQVLKDNVKFLNEFKRSFHLLIFGYDLP